MVEQKVFSLELLTKFSNKADAIIKTVNNTPVSNLPNGGIDDVVDEI